MIMTYKMLCDSQLPADFPSYLFHHFPYSINLETIQVSFDFRAFPFAVPSAWNSLSLPAAYPCGWLPHFLWVFFSEVTLLARASLTTFNTPPTLSLLFLYFIVPQHLAQSNRVYILFCSSLVSLLLESKLHKAGVFILFAHSLSSGYFVVDPHNICSMEE